MIRFESMFADVEDPRAANARHDFVSVLFIALLALLCGAESCADMADFGVAKTKLLRTVLRLPHGVPSHDTFSRVFRHLNPQAFSAAFSRFAQAFAENLEGVIAIDGKAVRGAHERGCKTTPLHLVNVWAAEARLVIGQQLAPGRNEVKGALNALALLSLEGCIVTADAMHCRPDTAKAILATGADYALALKDNQPTLRQDAEAGEASTTSIVRFFVLSTLLPAQRMIKIARTHWTIENQLHWVLDVDLAEDAARNRKDHGPQNLAILRKIALNLLRTHPDKASIRRKIKKAGWNDAFLLSLIGQMR